MSTDDMDVVGRLRAGTDSVTGRNFDTDEVLERSKQALHRRHTWQTAVAGTTTVALAVALALAGPVLVPGVGKLELPGSEQVRGLVGLDVEPTVCVSEDLTVEWGEESARSVDVLFVVSVLTDDGVREGTFEEEDSLPHAGVVAPLLLPEVSRALPVRADRDRAFPLVERVEDGYDRFTVDRADLPASGYAWWTTSELRSLPGVVRCGGLPVTPAGDLSAEFTINSWNGEAASGYVPCATSSPSGLTRVERAALGYCAYLD